MFSFAKNSLGRAYRSTDFRQLGATHGQAADESTDPHHDLVWELAKAFTASTEEAEAAMREIHADIRRYARRDEVVTLEQILISAIARRRLIRLLE
ncbi:MAG: hypothetical protein AB7J13_09820 [Pyrinomonadaceae bacterium]